MTDRTLPQYEHNGRHHTVAEWATLTGIRSYDINMRLRQGWTLDRIFAETMPSNAPGELETPEPVALARASWSERMLTHEGETMTVYEWSKRSGIPADLLKARLSSGWGLQRAMSYPKGGAPRVIDEGNAVRQITFQGDTMPLSSWARRLGISVPALLYRLKHWPFTKALTTPSTNPSSKRLLGLGSQATLKEAASKAGIAYPTVVSRLRSGWTLDQALRVPPRTFMGNDAHRIAEARRNASAEQPTPEASDVAGGGSATFETSRGPAGDASFQIAAN